MTKTTTSSRAGTRSERKAAVGQQRRADTHTRPRFTGSLLRSPRLAAVVIVAAGAWAYSNSFRGVLVFDDIGSIVSNPHITSVWPLTRSMSAPQDVTVAGRPVASLTLALNYALAPADARDTFKPAAASGAVEDEERFYRNIWGYHALNLAVHLLAALALFGVVRRTALAAGTSRLATPAAFVVALLWVVHPLQTEAVTYVVQRVESLMGLFYLLTLYCAIRAGEATKSGSQSVEAREPSVSTTPGLPNSPPSAIAQGAPSIVEGRTAGRLWSAAAVAACALGMGSKEAMVTAPVAVLLWDWTFHRTRWRLYAGLAATWLILGALVAANPRPHSTGFIGGWTWWASLQTQAGVVAHYLRLAIVPHPLVFDYAWPRAASLGEVAPQALLLVALLAVSLAGVVRRHALGFVGICFFLILAPTSSVLPIPTEVAAEHRMYLPVAAVIAVATAGLVKLATLLTTRGTQPHGRPPTATQPARDAYPAGAIIVVPAIALAVLFGTLTHTRNEVYATDEVLMRDTVDKRPLNLRARVGYGADLLTARRFEEAEAQLVVATRLEGSDKAHAQANMYLGSALCAQGRTAEGIAHLEQALALDPSLDDAHALLGEAYDSRGETARALQQFTLALAALPDNAAVLRRAAWLLATSRLDAIRDGRRAQELAERAVRLTGRRDILALEALMAAYAEQGASAQAAAAGREALALAQAMGNALFVKALQGEIATCEAGGRLRDR